jgi:mRNA interferase RelE/StbE
MKVILHNTANRYYKRLNVSDQQRIKAAMEKLSREPPEGDIFPMTGQKGIFRVRVGSLRLLYRVDETVIIVTHIDPRGQVYKKKNKED